MGGPLHNLKQFSAQGSLIEQDVANEKSKKRSALINHWFIILQDLPKLLSFMEPLIFQHCPFPPSDNALYRNVARVGRVKTAAYKHYHKEFEQWAWTQKGMQKRFQDWKLLPTDPLSLQLLFSCPSNRIYTQKGLLKRFDVQNRGKCLIDLFADFLGIDDTQFFSVFFIKTIAPLENVTLILSPKSPVFYDIWDPLADEDDQC